MSELTLQAARRIDPRRVVLLLGGIAVVLAIVGIVVEKGHGAWTFQAFSLADSDLDRRLGMPASFNGLLLLLSAGMTFALAGVDRTRRQRTWRLAGYALLLFGVEEVLGLHSWLEDQGVPWALAYVPFAAIGTVALVGVLKYFKSQPGTQALFAAAILLWLVAAAFDNPHLLTSDSAAEIFEMLAGSLFALTLLERLRYLARQYYPLEEGETRLSPDQIVAEAVDRIRFRPIVVGIAIATAAFAIQYVALHTGNYKHAEKIAILDLNNEQTLWATFQGSLIFAVALVSIVIGRLSVTRAEMKRWWLLLGAVLMVLGLDEIVAVHDRFQDSTGLPGQTILLPIAVVGVVAWFKVLGEIWEHDRARNLFMAGAAVWFLSQLIDVTIQHSMRWTITPEEVGETTGSTLWLFSLLLWLRSTLPVDLLEFRPAPGMLRGKTIVRSSTPEPEQESQESAQAPTG
jgi:hypothetical protein